MKNKIVFALVIAFSVIFGFSMISCNQGAANTVVVKNGTGEDIYIVVLTGTISFNELNKRIREFTNDEWNDYVVIIVADETKTYDFENSKVITYKWWTETGITDFGSIMVQDDKAVTILVKKP
jgi:hypothetical protein